MNRAVLVKTVDLPCEGFTETLVLKPGQSPRLKGHKIGDSNRQRWMVWVRRYGDPLLSIENGLTPRHWPEQRHMLR